MGSLKYQDGIAKLLYFGIGVRNIVHTLVSTDEGTSLLGLCATLSECFHKDYAAEVMWNIAKTLSPPGEIKPSVEQWQAIVGVCSGTLSTSLFPLSVEKLLRLDPGEGNWENGNFRSKIDNRGCPSAEDLAKVYHRIRERRIRETRIHFCRRMHGRRLACRRL